MYYYFFKLRTKKKINLLKNFEKYIKCHEMDEVTYFFRILVVFSLVYYY